MAQTTSVRRDAEGQPIETLPDDEFKAQLALVIPHLRAFGRSLGGQSRDGGRPGAGNAAEGLDGAQALPGGYQHARLDLHYPAQPVPEPGPSRALQGRLGRPGRRARAGRARVSQDKHIHLADVQRGLQCLPAAQREALVLVGAGGFAYEEAATICGVAVGTIKSRVARGRAALEALLESEAIWVAGLENGPDPNAGWSARRWTPSWARSRNWPATAEGAVRQASFCSNASKGSASSATAQARCRDRAQRSSPANPFERAIRRLTSCGIERDYDRTMTLERSIICKSFHGRDR